MPTPRAAPRRPRRVLLFDIDNTLLWSGGAGTVAMNAAFRDLFGIDDGFARVEFSGRTDRYIFAEALRQHRLRVDFDLRLEEFMRRYYDLLPGALRQKQGRLMPGFPQLLEELSRAGAVRLGLATGNFSASARMKLDYYGVGGFFAGGAFGEESEDRAEVVRLAMERLADGARREDVLVIGDTPHDVASALANGALAVGVATGQHGAQALRESGAQTVFEDFSDWRRAAALLGGGA